MKILIIGCGSIGGRHARVVHATGRHTLALCDANRAFADALAAELGIEEVYSDFEEAIAESKADAAIVCTPNHLHAKPAIAALDAGMHVLCEKPIASSSEDAKAMVDAAKRSKGRLMIGYTMRANRCLIEIKELLRSGKLGKITSARVILSAPETLVLAKSPYRKKYETGGGVIFDYSHELDYCHYLFGSAAKCAAMVNLNFPDSDTCDDDAEILVKYQNGITMTYHMDYIQEKGPTRGRFLSIVCEKGFIDTSFKNLTVYYNDGETASYDFEDSRDYWFDSQLKTFEALCRGEEKDYCSGQDAYEVILLAEALYQSAREEKFITL